MAWDLALSHHGDLILNAVRDVAGISGEGLIAQRIMIRLRVLQGAWIYDEESTLGSMLHTLIGRPPADAMATIPALVRQALRPMSSDILIQDVTVGFDRESNSVVIMVAYRAVSVDNQAPGVPENIVTVSVPIPISGGGGV